MGLNIDGFAGGGGASTGIEAAGFRVDIAIDHDPAAIAMHEKNHPHTRHYCENIWQVDPREACGGQHVDFAWFSPDCKHFSKASGGALKDRNIRGLAWVVLRWAGTVRPDCIIVENVEEFPTWGPVRKGKPVKALAGTTYAQWRKQLEALGYQVESREIIAADLGAPTSRKRFYLIARCDGRPIVWPEPTHGKPDTLEVAAGLLKPWRSAAEIIDWSLACPSIFETKQEIKAKYGINTVRPLAGATEKRIARGLDKFTIKSDRPFILSHKYANEPQDVGKPLTTHTAVASHEVVKPVITPYVMTNNSSWADVNCISPETPLRTVTTGRQNLLCAPHLIQYHSERSEKVRGQALDDSLATVDASNRYGLSAAHLQEYYGNAQDGLDLNEPMHTVTSKDRESLVVAHLLALRNNMDGQDVRSPMGTICTSPGHYGIIKTTIEKYLPGADLRYWPKVRAMLNKHCGYNLADDEVLLLWLRGGWYYIADIGLRMITAREAFRAQGFRENYIIEFDWQGKPFPKSEQMAKAGNSVCPPVAAALVKANHPALMQQVEIA